MNLNVLTSIDHRVIGFIVSGVVIVTSIIIILIRYYKGKNK